MKRNFVVYPGEAVVSGYKSWTYQMSQDDGKFSSEYWVHECSVHGRFNPYSKNLRRSKALEKCCFVIIWMLSPLPLRPVS